jgi:uncharacterized membrane protein
MLTHRKAGMRFVAPSSRFHGWLLERSDLVGILALAAITAIGGAIRAFNIGAKSLWFDEAVVYWISREADVQQIVAANAQGNSAPPLYVFLVRVISEIGTNEATLRTVSWLFGTVAIPVIFMLCRHYVSKRAAFASVAILAVAPVYVEYSQQLREYSMALCVSALMLLAYRKFKENGSWTSISLVMATFGIGILVQYGLGLLVLALNLAFLLEEVWFNRSTEKLRKWILGQGFVLLIVAFVWSSTLRHQFSVGGFGHVARGYFQGPILALPAFLARQTYDMVLFAFPDPPLFILLIGIAILSGIASVKGIHEHTHLVTPFLVAVGAGVGAIYPYVGSRQSIYLFPILLILVGMGFDYLMQVDMKGIVPLLLGLLLLRAALLPTIGYLSSEGLENLKPLVERLNDSFQEGDRVFVCYGAAPAFRYYYSGDLSRVVEGASSETWQEQYSTILDEPSRVWLVIAHCGDPLTFVRFAQEHRPIEEVESKFEAWLYLSP